MSGLTTGENQKVLFMGTLVPIISSLLLLCIVNECVKSRIIIYMNFFYLLSFFRSSAQIYYVHFLQHSIL